MSYILFQTVDFCRLTQLFWGTQRTPSQRTPLVQPFLLPARQEETVTQGRPCNIEAAGEEASGLTWLPSTLPSVFASGFQPPCHCCKPPLPSSLKLCTSFALLIMTPESPESLAFSSQVHWSTWKLLTLCATLGLWTLQTQWKVYRHRFPLLFCYGFLFGLRIRDLLLSTKLLCEAFLILDPPQPL